MAERIWTAALVVIGDEILSGRTHDKNIAQVASWLQVQGIRLAEVRVVPDVLRFVRDLIGDPKAPIGTRLAVGGLLLWLLNPVDLIPEFIPVLGPLDDVVVAVLVLRYVRRRLGEDAFRRRWSGSDEAYALLARVL